MNKAYLHHWWTRLRPIRTVYFLLACGVCAAIAVAALRGNYVTMTHLRAAAYSADQHNADVEQALKRLRAFVGSHMNTNLATSDGVYPPIQLKYTYQRLQQAEQSRVDTTNSQVYTDAQHTCEAQYPNSFSGGPRVPCIEQYVKDHGTTARTIPDAMYKFNFISPTWSPDVAGWALVLAGLFLLLTIVRFGAGLLLQRLSR